MKTDLINVTFTRNFTITREMIEKYCLDTDDDSDLAEQENLEYLAEKIATDGFDDELTQGLTIGDFAIMTEPHFNDNPNNHD